MQNNPTTATYRGWCDYNDLLETYSLEDFQLKPASSIGCNNFGDADFVLEFHLSHFYLTKMLIDKIDKKLI